MSIHEHYMLDGPLKGKTFALPTVVKSILCIAKPIDYKRILNRINALEFEIPAIDDFNHYEYKIFHTEKTDFGYTYDLRQIL